MSESVPTRIGFTLCAGSANDFGSVAYNLQYEMQPHTVVRMVRGNNMASAGALFNEFAAALQFPYYFGNNWNAFDECIADLQWLPADRYLIMIVNGSQVLREDPDELTTFLRIMQSATQEWLDVRGVPFNTFMQCADDELEIVGRMFASVATIAVSELKSFVSASPLSPLRE